MHLYIGSVGLTLRTVYRRSLSMEAESGSSPAMKSMCQPGRSTRPIESWQTAKSTV